jgi:predicted transglutaminase-like protease
MNTTEDLITTGCAAIAPHPINKVIKLIKFPAQPQEWKIVSLREFIVLPGSAIIVSTISTVSTLIVLLSRNLKIRAPADWNSEVCGLKRN